MIGSSNRVVDGWRSGEQDMLGPTTCGTCSLPRHTIRERID
ncbi:hypothetical protein L083_2124 [Actinoplanes sp. N902-109]|nr:hypothetical protein L083_2124 [Actinoplanes sp. N902-109]